MRRTWLVWVVIGFGYGCSLDAGSRGPFGPEDPETAVQKTPLPDKIPAPNVFQFTGDDTDGHHKPRMVGAVPDPSVKRSVSPSVVLTADDVIQLRKAAEGDRRVAALLGKRWTFIDADRMLPEGKVSFGCCREESSMTRLVYYSYSQNVAVDVRLKETASSVRHVLTATNHRRGNRMSNGGSSWRRLIRAWLERWISSTDMDCSCSRIVGFSEMSLATHTAPFGLPSPKERTGIQNTGPWWI
ncbi:MAG: hypothetical protein E8D52_02105 [Nitrospira sp.]|nr:MAG: hypothetical protein E8D52_02105 [Nitrospira sp.]